MSTFNFLNIKTNMSNQDNQHQLNIELSEEIAEGVYSNLAIITHSHAEFVVDFIKVMPGVPKAKVKSRIVMTPQNTKRLMMALRDNIAKFEQQHGTHQRQRPPRTRVSVKFWWSAYAGLKPNKL
jgi:hypothetical protein